MEDDVKKRNALELAYLGDAVFELQVRKHLLLTDLHGVQELNKKAFQIVNAKSQAKIVHAIKDELTESEWETVKYGRNAKGGSSKASSIGEYRYATGLECLLGKLYLEEEFERIEEIIELSLQVIEGEDHE
ncbi:Mini-ribonuclease 3 [Guggenheimella bovis]